MSVRSCLINENHGSYHLILAQIWPHTNTSQWHRLDCRKTNSIWSLCISIMSTSSFISAECLLTRDLWHALRVSRAFNYIDPTDCFSNSCIRRSACFDSLPLFHLIINLCERLSAGDSEEGSERVDASARVWKLVLPAWRASRTSGTHADSLVAPKCASSLDVRTSSLHQHVGCRHTHTERSEILVWECDNDSVNPLSDVQANSRKLHHS